MADYRDDVSRYRTLVSGTHDNYSGTHNVNDVIGRQTGVDKVRTTSVTATSGVALLPASPLPRRNYIKVKTVGTTTVEILYSTASGVVGYPLPQNAEWEENTDAVLYIKSTGADSEVRVYERAEGYNLDKS